MKWKNNYDYRNKPLNPMPSQAKTRQDKNRYIHTHRGEVYVFACVCRQIVAACLRSLNNLKFNKLFSVCDSPT